MADEGEKFADSFHPKEAGDTKKKESRWNKVERVQRSEQPQYHHEYSQEKDDRTTKRRSSGNDEEPEKKKMAIGFSIGQKKSITANPSEPQRKSPVSMLPVSPIKMNLGAQKPKKEPQPALKKASATVASVFNQDDDDSDPEEMPPEAKMRMRNIGRDTPTAAGPNSYGKGRLGFCDRQKIIERELKSKMDKV